MQTLVTGANGLLGNHLVHALLADGHQVRAMVRRTSNLKALEGLDIDFAYGDVKDPTSLREAAQGCDIVYHTAAVFSYWGYSRDEMLATARQGAINAVDAARDAGVKRLILTSSSSVFGRNDSKTLITEETRPNLAGTPDYFSSKALQERTAIFRAKETGVDLICVNPSVFIGPWDFRPSASLSTVTGYLFDPMKLTYPGGANVVHVADVARGHILLAENGEPGERYLLGADNWDWHRIHSTISELCGLKGPHLKVGRKAALLGTTLMEAGARLTGKPPLGTRSQAQVVGSYFWYDHSKAAALGYQPRSTHQALVDTIAWLLDSDHITPAQRTGLRISPEITEARQRLLSERVS